MCNLSVHTVKLFAAGPSQSCVKTALCRALMEFAGIVPKKIVGRLFSLARCTEYCRLCRWNLHRDPVDSMRDVVS